MGSFIGHAIPGGFFFLFGVWWLTQVTRRYILCRETRQQFRTTATFPFPYCPGQRIRNIPLEPIVKMVLCGLGIIVEIIGGINHTTHRFDSIGNAQHITMYFFFALSGVLDLLTLKNWAPRSTDYVGVIIALLVEGALFKFHLFGRSELDVLLHTLLLYVIWLSVLVMALEAAFRNNAVLPLLRCLLCMLQGTWFWGVGLILYNPFPGATPWDHEDHHALMLAVVCFSWHLAVNLVIVIAVGGFTACCYRNRRHYSELHTSSVPLKSLENGADGQARVFHDELEDDDELGVKVGDGRDIDNSDVEFQAPVRK